jgi:hypothetical protein
LSDQGTGHDLRVIEVFSASEMDYMEGILSRQGSSLAEHDR